MIAGPELLQSRTHILELLSTQPGLIERDLVLLHRDLDLGGKLFIDGLLKDAIGRLVVLFVPGTERGGEFPGCLIEAEAWLLRNLVVIQRLYAAHAIRWDLPRRFLVLTHDANASLIQRLASIRGIDVDVCELVFVRADGELHWACVPRLGTGAGMPMAEPVGGGRVAAAAPAPCEAPRHWEVLKHDIGRIDREIALVGDRYRVDVQWRGHSIAQLSWHGDAVEVQPVTGDRLLIDGDRGVPAALDLLMRAFLRVFARVTGPSIGTTAERKGREAVLSASVLPDEPSRSRPVVDLPRVRRLDDVPAASTVRS